MFWSCWGRFDNFSRPLKIYEDSLLAFIGLPYQSVFQDIGLAAFSSRRNAGSFTTPLIPRGSNPSLKWASGLQGRFLQLSFTAGSFPNAPQNWSALWKIKIRALKVLRSRYAYTQSQR